MITTHRYELWKGGKSVGECTLLHPIFGGTFVVPELSELKRPHGRKIKKIEVPVKIRCVSDDGVTIILKRILDVTKKSARQIEILKGYK